jgi:N-acetylmuramoyl-L-alanine amidase
MFYVLVSTRMPAILFESSFVSNADDERRLRSPHFQQTEAEAIVEAIGAWFARQKDE